MNELIVNCVVIWCW